MARARLYYEAGADAIFPEALTSVEMFKEFVRRLPDVPLLANMTEFGRTPYLSASEFEEMATHDYLACQLPAGSQQGAG